MFFKKSVIIYVALIVFLSLLLFPYARPELKFRYVKVKQNDTFWKLFKDKWEIVSRINKIDKWHLLPGKTLKVPLDWELAKKYPFFPEFLEQEKEVPKLILVVIQEQFLAGYEFGQLKFWYPISSGRKGYPTPMGKFKVSGKERHGYSHIYKTPMPWTLAINKLYALHGGQLPGYPASHGCIRLFLEDAAKLYQWAQVGTIVLIIGSFEEKK